MLTTGTLGTTAPGRNNSKDGGPGKEEEECVVWLECVREDMLSETPPPQAQVHHLLTQNKELLAHMQKLILQIQQLQLAQAATPLPSVQDLLAPIDAPVTTVAT